jgi:uroporphyrinogen decarboxylase
MKQTGFERVITALNLQEPDTVPTFEFGIDQKVISAIKPGLSYYDFCDYMDLDAVCYSEARFDQIVDKDKGIIRDEWGAIQRYSSAGTLPIPKEPAIKSEEDLDSYISPDPDMPARFKGLEAIVDRFKGRKAIIGSVRPFPTVRDSLRGQEQLFRDIIRNPDFVIQLNDIVDNYYMRYLRNLIDAGVDIILEAGDWAYNQGPMIAPEHTAMFLAPSLKRIADYCHSRDIPCLKHTDGNIWDIFEIIVDTGIDAVHPVDPLAGMDIGEAKARYGDKLCLMGNIDCGQLLSWGTKDEVRQTVKDCVRKAGRGGGYICMSSNVIHSAVNPENYVEMVKAIREYGRYPLRPG